MADLGFKELSIEPVVAPPDAPYALTEEDLPKLLSEYERLAGEMLERKREGKGRDFTFYHYMIDLTGGPCIVKPVSYTHLDVYKRQIQSCRPEYRMLLYRPHS